MMPAAMKIEVLLYAVYITFTALLHNLARCTGCASDNQKIRCPRWLRNYTDLTWFDLDRDCHNSDPRSEQCYMATHCCLAFNCQRPESFSACRQFAGLKKAAGTPSGKVLDFTQLRCDMEKMKDHRTGRAVRGYNRGNKFQQRCMVHCILAFGFNRRKTWCRCKCAVNRYHSECYVNGRVIPVLKNVDEVQAAPADLTAVTEDEEESDYGDEYYNEITVCRTWEPPFLFVDDKPIIYRF